MQEEVKAPTTAVKATNPEAPEVNTTGFDLIIKTLPIDALEVGYHPRKYQGDINTLKGSIERDGLQEPLQVCQLEGVDRFRVIDGTRRLEALKALGQTGVPCLLSLAQDVRDADHLSYICNVERASLNCIEIAHHIKFMQETYDFSYAELEIKGYGSAASISNKVKLLSLSKEVQDKIVAGQLSETHGLHLAKLPSHDEQSRMAQRFYEKDISANRGKFHVNNYLAKLKASSKHETAILAPTGKPDNVFFKDSSDMREIADERVHLIVTSPPYHVGMEFEQDIPFADHMENIKAVLAECARVLVPGGIMALNVADIRNFRQNIGQTLQKEWKLMGHLYQKELQNHNIILQDMIMWEKNTPWRHAPRKAYDEQLIHTQYEFHNNFEPIYIFKKAGSRQLPGEPINSQSALTKKEWVNWIASTWKISSTRKESEHPCEWPDELPRRLIRMFSFIGDVVLDPWLGSGTTVKVAEELGRQGIGYERYEKYFSMIKERLGNSAKALEEKKAVSEKPLSSPDDTDSYLTLEEFGEECQKGIVELPELPSPQAFSSTTRPQGDVFVIKNQPSMTPDQIPGEAVAAG